MTQRATIALLFLATTLLLLIGWRAHRLLELRSQQQQLESVALAVRDQELDMASKTLRHLSLEPELTPRQRELRSEALLDFVEKAIALHPPVRSVGRHTWKRKAGPYLVTHDQVTISAQLPDVLAPWVQVFRSGDLFEEFSGSPARADLSFRIPEGGETFSPPLVLAVKLPEGLVREVGLPYDVSIRRVVSRLNARLLLEGEKEYEFARAGSDVPTCVIDSGARASVRFSNPAALTWVKWTLGAQSESKELPTALLEWTIDLPPISPETRQRELLTLSVEARTAADTADERQLQLDVRGSEFNPVVAIRVNGTKLTASDEPTCIDRRSIVIQVSLNAPAKPGDLVIRADGKTHPCRDVEGSWQTEPILLPEHTPVGIVLFWGSRALLPVHTVRVDTSPPRVRLLAGEDREIPPDVETVVESGTQLTLEVRDDGALSSSSVQVTTDRLTTSNANGPASERPLRWAFGAPKDGTASLTVVATDRVGHRTELAFQLRVRTELRIESMTLGEQPAEGLVTTRAPTAPMTIRYHGSGTLSLRALDEEGRVVSETSISLTADGSNATADVSLEVPENMVRRRRVELLRGETVLRQFDVTVDREQPIITFLDARGAPLPSSMEAEPRASFAVEVTDANPGGEPRVEGAEIGARTRTPLGWRLELQLASPARREIKVVATDAVGNETTRHLTLVHSRSPQIRLLLDGAPPATLEPMLQVRRLSDVSVEVDGGEIVEAYLGDRPLDVATGHLPDVEPTPQSSLLIIRAKSAAGHESRTEHRVQFLPWKASAAVQQRLARLQGLQGRDRSEAVEQLEQEVMLDAKKYALTGDLTRFLEGLRSLRPAETGAPGPNEELLPTTRTNERDGAELVLITPQPGGPKFEPFYIYRTEVARGMFQKFLEEVGSEIEWWRDVPDPFDPSRPVRKPESLRMLALRRLGSQRQERLPVIGITHELAMAYARWAQAGLPAGELRIPLLSEWQMAAGRALVADAAYPTTGKFPRGQDLLDFRHRGEQGGAAFGYTIPESPQAAGTYDPGAFGLLDMAGNAWEWVRDNQQRWLAIGGGFSSDKEDCKLDRPVKSLKGTQRRHVGLRLIWKRT